MVRARMSTPVFHVADDPLFLQHRSRGYHPERPERLLAARRGVERCAADGVAIRALAPRDATDEEILRAHDASYVEALLKLDGQYAALDGDTYVVPDTIRAARRSAGAAIALVEALMSAGGPARGAALGRPPGHHATREQGMGFCLLNNVAIAASAALAAGLSKVAIVDWDVHHGNGTQDVFWESDDVLFISLHEMPLYPGTGAPPEVGEGEGRGYTINVPLSASAGDAAYKLAFEEVVLPALRWFSPELVLVSAGYDAHERDPLASMMVSEAGYGWMAAELAAIADASAGGKIGLVLEGGYDLTAIEGSLAASIHGVMGSGEQRPIEGHVSAAHRAEIDKIRRIAEGARVGATAR